jgi:hypothetical protein
MDFHFILGVLGKEKSLKKITLNHDKGVVFMANLQDTLILGFETNK